jgi:hypothetical protein
VSDWVFEYTKNVFHKTISMYDYIFYTDPSDVELIDDGERSTDIDFRNKMIETFEVVISNHSDSYFKNKLIRLKGTVEERMEAIKIILCQQLA